MVQHVTAGCFGNSCRYSVVQLHWGAAVPPLSGRQSFGNSWGFPWPLNATVACFSGRVGCGVVTSASSSMRSGYCGTDVADIYSGEGRQDARCFFSTQSHSSVGLLGPEAYQAGDSLATGPVRPHRSEANTIQALMDLALPRFEGLGDGPRQVHRPWMVSTESPDPGYLTELLRSLSPCLNLDALSSDDTEGSVGFSNLSVTLLCGSDDGHTPVNSDEVLSDEDLPPVVGSEDSRQVIRIRDISPDVQIVDISQVGRAWDSRRTVSKGGSGKRMPLSGCVPATATSGRAIDDAPGLSAYDPSPVVGAVDLPAVGRVETIQLFASDVRPAVPWISSDGCL